MPTPRSESRGAARPGRPLGDEAVLDDLVPGIVTGDEDAYVRLYGLLADSLASFAYRMVRDRGFAEDAVQQAFLELAGNRSGFRGDGVALRAWLYRSVRFSCLDELRRRSRRPEHPTDRLPEVVSEEDPSPGMDPELEEALDQLTPTQRAVVLLRHVEGFDGAEIAEILGMSRVAVYAAGSRAEARLRKLLRPVESQDGPTSQDVKASGRAALGGEE